jgi:hypothetical protein
VIGVDLICTFFINLHSGGSISRKDDVATYLLVAPLMSQSPQFPNFGTLVEVFWPFWSIGAMMFLARRRRVG